MNKLRLSRSLVKSGPDAASAEAKQQHTWLSFKAWIQQRELLTLLFPSFELLTGNDMFKFEI